MASDALYQAEHIGDWGTPAAPAGGDYAAETVRLPDGTDLFFRAWRAADAAAPVLVFLHGLGAHTGWFIDMGNALSSRGLSVAMDDHRGFGRSGGPRGHVRRGNVYLDDLGAFLDEVQRRQPQAPLFLAGHSMGGIFATYLAAADARAGRNRIRGLVLLNPWVKEIIKVPFGTLLAGFPAGLLGSAAPFPLPPNPAVMTTNPEAVALLNDDRYWVSQQSKAFLVQLLGLRNGILKQAREVRAPALAIQSEADRSVSQRHSRKLFAALGSTDKTWKAYPGYAHDFEFEPDRSALDNDLADWIVQHQA
ncbi:MAG TPA: alpha/beta hydrolase [Ktedonobacterales bacterium]